MMDLGSFVAGALLWALQAASSLPPEPQDPDRPRVSIRDFKGLRENNVFAPARPPRTERRHSEGPRPASAPPPPPPPSRPRTPLVTGFVFDEREQALRVLVEDRNSDAKLRLFDKPCFLKEGEEFMGWTIESVAKGSVSVRVGETVKELRVGDSFPEKGGGTSAAPETPGEMKTETTPPGAGEKTEAAPAAGEKVESTPPKGEKTEAAPAVDDAARSKVLEELKKKFQKKREASDFQEP